MSTQKLPTFKIRSLEPIGVELFFDFPDITNTEKSYFEADSLAGATSLTAGGLNFAANDYIILGQPGFSKSEIVKVTSVTATTIVCGATVYPHSRGDAITWIPYNQIVLSYSTDGTTYTAATAIGIDANAKSTFGHRSTDTSAYYYKYRFFNSTTSTYSAYSDVMTGAGYADNSLFAIKQDALNSMGESYSDLITDSFLNAALRAGRRTVDQDPRVLRWSFRTVYNYIAGSMISGKYSVPLPTDLRDQFSNKNILGVRVGKQSYTLTYQDNIRFRQNYYNIPHTTLNGAVAFGDTTITLTDSGDFPESGTITIGSQAVNTLKTTITYTGNNELTNVLSGVTGIPAAGFATGADVWQNATFGVPRAYTIENGVMYFDLPFDDNSDGENIYIDYYKSMTELLTDSQTVDEPFYDMYSPWLRWKIKYLKANGKIDAKTDTDYLEFQDRLTQLIAQEVTGQYVRFVPTVTSRGSIR